MKYATVTTNLLDLRAGPRFESERLSQLLFGDVVETGGRRHGYCRIRQADGYTGWADARFLEPVSQRAAATYRRLANHIVIAARADLKQPDSKDSEPPHFVFYGSRLQLVRNVRGLAQCRLANGRSLHLNRNHVRPIHAIKKDAVTSRIIVKEALRFLGVPYLWGGVSPSGFDCSGLMRAVFGRFDIYLPRDTKGQVRLGQLVSRDMIRAGDLLFFKRHVALSIGGSRLLHASMGGSGVRINSLCPDDDDYRADLDRDFALARRLL